MTYLFDNCISPRYARMLAALGVDAQALSDHYPSNIDDIHLFRKLKGSHVVFITADRRQTTRQHEARAIREAGITALWFGPFWSRKRIWDQAIWLVQHWEKIDGFASGAAQGVTAEIKQNGRAMVFQL